MLDWLRRCLGESSELRNLRAENSGLLRQLRDTQWAVRHNRRTIAGMDRVFGMLVEPMQSGECRKVRLRNRAEAEEFARRVEVGAGNGGMEPYRCPICPRQPLDPMARFWHVRHVDHSLRGRVWHPKPATPQSIGRVASPVDVARVLGKTKGMKAS